MPGGARLHQSIERAIPLVPGPYHQWETARRIGGLSYVEWRRLDPGERDRRARELATLNVTSWQDGQIENWQAKHPPLYYALVGYAARLSGATTLMSAHRFARVMSAALFATTGVLLTAFIIGPWGASPRTALFVCLLPMWYVIGARISNDALAIPALSLALLVTIDQIRRPVASWRRSAWVVAGAAAAIGLAAKGYGLIFAAVALTAIVVALHAVVRKGAPARAVWLPVLALAIMLVADGWWLIENEARGAGLIGTNVNVRLMTRGIVTMTDRLPYARTLIVEQPKQALSALLRSDTQMLYASNWTIGAAPWWFYLLQLGLLATIARAATVVQPVPTAACRRGRGGRGPRDACARHRLVGARLFHPVRRNPPRAGVLRLGWRRGLLGGVGTGTQPGAAGPTASDRPRPGHLPGERPVYRPDVLERPLRTRSRLADPCSGGGFLPRSSYLLPPAIMPPFDTSTDRPRRATSK